jgi:toxin YoeB
MLGDVSRPANQRRGRGINRKTALRVLDLIDAVLRDPVGGLGKPEPLKHLGGNVWSRRINEADHLVYEVFADPVEFLQARYHY